MSISTSASLPPRVETYDVFDTALVRCYLTPVDLYATIDRRLREQGWPAGFQRLRNQAERLVRSRVPNGEANHAEIHATFAEVSGWTAEACATARAAELEEEARLYPVRAVAEQVAAARARGAQVAFVSDMYLPGNFLRECLLHAGVAQPEDEVVVSCEQRESKRSGVLYSQLKRRWPGWSTHTGDNPHNDLLQALRHQIPAVRTDAAAPTAWETRLRKFVPDRPEWAGAIRAARVGLPRSPHHELGAGAAGPLVYSFLRWLDAAASRDGVEQLWFAAREGELLVKCARAMQLAVPCYYLPVSRQALSRCVHVLPEDSVPVWVRDSDERTVNATMRNLGLDPAEWSEQLERCGFARDSWARRRRWHREELLQLLAFVQDPVVAEHMEAEALRMLAAAIVHFREVGLRDGTQIGFVDLGWHGTTQHAFEKMLAQGGMNVRVTGYYLAVEDNSLGVDLRAMEYGPGSTDRYLCYHHPVLESLLSASHGQVTGYDEGGPACAAHLTFAPEEVAALQEGAVAFCALAHGIGLKPPPLRVWLDEFLRVPPFDLARTLGSARYNSGISAGSTLIQRSGQPGVHFGRYNWGPGSAWRDGWLAVAAPMIPAQIRRGLGLALGFLWRARNELRLWLRRGFAEKRI